MQTAGYTIDRCVCPQGAMLVTSLAHCPSPGVPEAFVVHHLRKVTGSYRVSPDAMSWTRVDSSLAEGGYFLAPHSGLAPVYAW